jgi:hypothetical protein
MRCEGEGNEALDDLHELIEWEMTLDHVDKELHAGFDKCPMCGMDKWDDAVAECEGDDIDAAVMRAEALAEDRYYARRYGR